MAGAALVGLTAFAAQAQQQCGPMAKVSEYLTGQYGEALTIAGLMPNGMMQIWVNPNTGTWTLLKVMPDGSACMMASGDSASITVPLAGDPA